MDVKICAFSLGPGTGITLTEFFTSLAAKGLHEIEDSLLAVTINGHIVSGVLLSPKDSKAFCTLTKNGGKIEIKAEDLAAGKIVADFNFFLFDLTKGRGLYQTYFRAASLQDFFGYLRAAWKKRKEEIFAAAGITPGNAMSSQSARIRRNYKGVVKGDVVYRAHTFEQKIDMLASVNRLTFSVVGAQAIGGAFAPFGGNLKAAAVSISFIQQANWQQVKSQVKALTGQAHPKAATIYGQDDHGNEVMYRMLNDVDVVEVLDFDQITQALHIDSNNIAATMAASPITTALVNLSQRADIVLLFNTGQRG